MTRRLFNLACVLLSWLRPNYPAIPYSSRCRCGKHVAGISISAGDRILEGHDAEVCRFWNWDTLEVVTTR